MYPSRRVAITIVCTMLSACAPGHSGHDNAPVAASTTTSTEQPKTATHSDRQDFRSNAYGFRIDYPEAMTAHRDFNHGYLANGAWKTFAGPDSSGHPVLELVLAASNHITAGALRIGVSSAASDIRQCTTPPNTANTPHPHPVDINGATFTYFEAADGAMSHYLMVHSYRTVHAGRCYAIDLLVTGTRPQVYSPPATPPFSHKQAFARLQHALRGFHFLQTH